VFAPAEDGGYVLVGASAFPATVFQDISWGESTVMTDTRQRLREAGWALGREWSELDTYWDIDRPADLRRAADAGLIDASWLDTTGMLARAVQAPIGHGQVLWSGRAHEHRRSEPSAHADGGQS
jgi:hypothetical protein